MPNHAYSTPQSAEGGASSTTSGSN
jgi:hypothetical protein